MQLPAESALSRDEQPHDPVGLNPLAIEVRDLHGRADAILRLHRAV